MRNSKSFWIRFRVWRLNRWADALLKEAEYHKHSAKQHSDDASRFWFKSSDLRALARRMSAT